MHPHGRTPTHRMMAPIPPLAPPQPAADSGLPEVRLDARVGSGRSLSFDLQRGEMLIGGAEGCDLRLPGAHLPPVICQFTRTEQAVSFRRLAPAFPILHNGVPLVGTSPVKIGPGDRIAIGSADIVVNLHPKGHVKPAFTPLLEKKASARQVPALTADYSQERQALDSLKLQLAEQAKELEADRVTWYRRRQEVETEVRRMQESVTAGTKQAEREQWLAKREADVQAKENELYGVREELAEIRESLFAQYRERRGQLGQMQDAIQDASAAFQQRETELETEFTRRRTELDGEAGRLQEYVAAEVARRVADVEGEYRRRHMEAEVKYSEKLNALEAEASQRREQLAREVNTFEPQMATLIAERAQLDHGFRDLTHQRQSLENLRDELKRERAALEGERRWQEERYYEREGLLVAREGELARTEERLQTLRSEEDGRKDRYSDELMQIERWQATADERQQAIDRRAEEVDQRVQQLARDAAELEEHMTLAEVEQQTNAAEAERLERLKGELDSRASQLAERSSELETQQASLAIVEAQIERQRDEQERETLALAADRARLDASQKEIEDRLRESEEIRTALGSARSIGDGEVKEFERRTAMLDAAFGELQQQKDAFLAEMHRIAQKEAELDSRSADIAQQTAMLKAKTNQVFDLRERLEADRSALRERENAVLESDQARAAFQETLRKRSEELAGRSKQLDELNARLTDDKHSTERLRAELAQERDRLDQSLAEQGKELGERESALAELGEGITEREASLARQIERLRVVGQTVAAGRKAAFEQKQQFEMEQAGLLEQSLSIRRDLETYRLRAAAEIQQLREQAPELEDQAKFTFEKLNSAREILKGQLAELHTYAGQSREALDALRYELRSEAERIRNREEELDRAKGEHRIAVAEFRQQLHDWQARVGELRTTMARSEYRIEQKKADLAVAGRKTEATAGELTRRMEELQLQQDDVATRRIRIEAHLNDMREWYRKKLRDLAEERSHAPKPTLKRWESEAEFVSEAAFSLDPGDKQLGELLQSLELVEAETIRDLWAEAQRQRRTLRQVLLSSGAISLYQLALIEAGNLEALVIGRFRVIDRVRATPREAVYRVFDPERPSEACVLRILGDAEMNDATRPDEYRQRFAAAADATHPGLIATHEVLEIQGRPAVVQEYASGIPASEWPIGAAVPGIWLQLVIEAAAAVEAAHKAGLTHGRLSTEAFTLMPTGALKLGGFGEPPWLLQKNTGEASYDLDLRAFGQVAHYWSQLGTKKKGRAAKAFPEPLLDVLRRLEADVPGNTTAGEPYGNATELLSDLLNLAEKYPCPGEAWAEFLGQISVQPTLPMPAKKSA